MNITTHSGTRHEFRDVVSKICEVLRGTYSVTSLGNKRNPLDEYLFILLSLRTHEKGLEASYRGFKEAFPSWTAAARATANQIAKAIETGGLSRQKAQRIRKALRHIKEEFGEVSLRKLRRMTQEDAERFLLALPGVGLKSARCIMMYSLGFEILPVDVHVSRISTRLGWVPKAGSTVHHRLLEDIIPPALRFAFHVCCVQHGRAVCRGQYPKCEICCLSDHCPRVGLKR